MKPITIFRHEDWIKGGFLVEFLSKKDIPMRWVKIDKNDSVPTNLDDTSGLIFLGGTMSVNHSFSWISQEIDLIEKAAKIGMPVIGHCFGSQLISKALGGIVTPMHAKEIGWYEIKLSDDPKARHWFTNAPKDNEILLWHHEEFTIPDGAISLYESQYCKNQAFTFNNILATVGHIELSEQMLYDWLDIYGYDIVPNCDSVQRLEYIADVAPEKIKKMHRLSAALYTNWLKSFPEFSSIQLAKKLVGHFI